MIGDIVLAAVVLICASVAGVTLANYCHQRRDR